ncbi:MAG: T9SS type A sorting domain-containing protein, partial [Bacteroidales bacterium]
LPGNYMLDLVVTDGNGCSYTAYDGLTISSGSGNSTINGSVYEGDQTISLAIVQLIQIDSTGYPHSIQNTVPGINNQFIFENVADGDYYLHAIPFTNSTDTISYLPTFYLNSVFWETATTINLGTAQNPYDIHLVSFDMVDGGVYTINGQIVNSGKSMSVADQEVLLFDSQGNIVQYTFTDANGYFTFNSLPAGTYGINPVMTGLTTYPFYVVLNENNNPAFVRMVISGNIITSTEKQILTESRFTVFPNPAHESITITCDKKADKILIGNYLGNIMIEANKPEKIYTADVSLFPAGIYFIKVIAGNEESVKKVVVTH